jgi:peptidoglycan/LPS O-acetylase OafA/YrhL
VYRTHRTRHPDPMPGWGPAPGWGQSFPGWNPLIDHSPLPLRAASSVARWWWPILALAGFAAVAGLVLSHDQPAPGLSVRGLVTLALAALVVVLLTLHRAAGPGPLTRAVAE